MFLLVKPTGAKLWRVKYRFASREQLLSLGSYPKVSLKQAREKRQKIREQVAAGIDSSAVRKAIKAALAGEGSFESLAREWYQQFSPGWTPEHADQVLRRLRPGFTTDERRPGTVIRELAPSAPPDDRPKERAGTAGVRRHALAGGGGQSGSPRFTTEELASADLRQWRIVRARREQCRRLRVLGRWFRQDPDAYLQALEERLIKLSLPP